MRRSERLRRERHRGRSAGAGGRGRDAAAGKDYRVGFAGVLGGGAGCGWFGGDPPPDPLPEGKGEKDLRNPVASGMSEEATRAFTPLPEGRGVGLGGPRGAELPFPAEADFVISGWIDPTRTKPEGPFGDHLGYYSLAHDFPVMTVEKVYHRPGAIWPFTVVGRPPQEDTSFGEFIHELTGPVIPTVVPGVHAVHAVDAAGVHPVLLAIGSERYVPYADTRRPQELLTLANAVLGQGQLSLAKYLFIVAKEDNPALDIHDISAFFRHLLERFDPTRDLHFQTRTTIDTLDYSAGLGLNAGSKLVIAAAGPPRRTLGTTVPAGLNLPDGFSDPRVALPGVLAVRGPKFRNEEGDAHPDVVRLCSSLSTVHCPLPTFPLIVVGDDSDFVSRALNNFLWVVFTPQRPGARRLRCGRVHASQALGLPRAFGD